MLYLQLTYMFIQDFQNPKSHSVYKCYYKIYTYISNTGIIIHGSSACLIIMQILPNVVCVIFLIIS
jgi:hypothetical protein